MKSHLKSFMALVVYCGKSETAYQILHGHSVHIKQSTFHGNLHITKQHRSLRGSKQKKAFNSTTDLSFYITAASERRFYLWDASGEWTDVDFALVVWKILQIAELTMVHRCCENSKWLGLWGRRIARVNLVYPIFELLLARLRYMLGDENLE